MPPRIDDPVREVVARVPVLADADELTAAPLVGGLSNANYLVTADGIRYVVRIAGESGPLLGIDRTREEAVARRAARAGIAPEVIAFLHPEGHAVTRYVTSAHPLTFEEFASPTMIPRVADRLRDIHGLDPVDGSFDPYADIARWLELVDARHLFRPDRLGPLLTRVAAVERAQASKPADPVLCHNDPYHLNFLDDGSLWVIDWEYAGMGDARYDLAGVGYGLDAAGRDLLVETYYGKVDPAVRRDLDDIINVYLCWNVVWSLLRIDDGENGFDYAAFAEELLDVVR